MVPTSGNRAGGTVTLSYEYGLFQKPTVDPAQGEVAATQRCDAWGYAGAEPFGGALKECEAHNAYGECLQTRVDVTYQCTGNPAASHG
jgi:YecR-like lipoprotein